MAKEKAKKQGILLKKLDPFYRFTPFIMKTREDASNYFRDSIDTSAADAFILKKRAEGLKGLGMMHLFIAAYVRAVSQKPVLNRFIQGQRIYARNYIEVVMTVKKSMEANAGETTIKVIMEPTDTITDVYNKMNAAIDTVKKGEETSGADAVSGLLMKLPRFVLRFAIKVIEILDYYGMLPKIIRDASPFHGSMIISDIGSLGIPPIYHHLYNFGNMPIFLTIGVKRRAYEVDKNGEVHEKKYMDYTVVCDERICDGFNYSQGFKMLKNLIKYPEQLDRPPEKVYTDPALDK